MHRIMQLSLFGSFVRDGLKKPCDPLLTGRAVFHITAVFCLLLLPIPSCSNVHYSLRIYTRWHSFEKRKFTGLTNNENFCNRVPRSVCAGDPQKIHVKIVFVYDYNPGELLTYIKQQATNHTCTIAYISDGVYDQNRASGGDYLIKMSKEMGIPTIAWIGDNSGIVQPSLQDTTLQLAPSISHQCRAMLRVMQRYQWHSFSILTGSLAGQDHFINVLRELTEEIGDSYKFEILSVVKIFTSTEAGITNALRRLKMSDTRVTLLYASRREADKFFAVANAMGLTSSEYVWIGCKAVVGSSSVYPPGMIATTFPVGITDRVAAAELAINTWLYGITKIQTLQENVSFFPPNYNAASENGSKWPIGEGLINVMKSFMDEGEEGEDDEAVYNADGTRTKIEINIKNFNERRSWNQVGSWTTENGLTMDDVTWPGGSPSPPKGVPSKYHLKVVTLEEPPYVYYSNPDAETGTCPPQSELCRIAPENATLNVANATSNSSLYQCCSGLCIDLLKMLAEKMSVDFDLFEVEDKKWGGYSEETGEWNGLVRTVMDGKADMIVTSLKITEERSEQIDFSIPFLETGITILVAVRDGVISPTAFLEPFDILSWLFILIVCMHVVAVSIWVFEWISPSAFDLTTIAPREPYDYPSWCLILVFSVHASGAAIFIFEWLSPNGLDRGDKPIRGESSQSNQPENGVNEHRFSLFRSFWLIWAMLFGAAVNVDNPRGVSSRFLANVWALFAVVFTASYTANLAAFMITKEDFDKLSGIQDWRLTHPTDHKPPFKFATVPDGSTEMTLKKNYPDMHDYMREHNRSTVKDGVKAVKDSEINAFIYDATVLEYLASHDDKCKLRTVGSWYAMTGYGISFPKGSKWLPIVNKHLINFLHDGDMERLQKFWLAGACKKNDAKGESSKPLGILNFTSAFILLAGGMLLGGLLLLLEHIYFKFFRTKLRKWDKCGCCGLVSLSMGKSLTFEQSVREAMDLQKNFRCKNPICETQVWKLKHELDLALLKIHRLQTTYGENYINPENKKGWGENPGVRAAEKRQNQDRRDKTSYQNPTTGGATARRRQQDDKLRPKGQKVSSEMPAAPPPIGWKEEYTNLPQTDDISAPSYSQAVADPSFIPANSAFMVDQDTDEPIFVPNVEHCGPMSKINPSNRYSMGDNDTHDGGFTDKNKTPRKTRTHKGNVYTEVGKDAALEKETVL